MKPRVRFNSGSFFACAFGSAALTHAAARRWHPLPVNVELIIAVVLALVLAWERPRAPQRPPDRPFGPPAGPPTT